MARTGLCPRSADSQSAPAFFSELESSSPAGQCISCLRSLPLLAQETQPARTYQGLVLRRVKCQLALKAGTRRFWKFPGPTPPATETTRTTSVGGGAGEMSDTGSHAVRRRSNSLSRQSSIQPCRRSGGLRADPLFRRSTRPRCCRRRRRGKAQDGGQNARRISEGQFKGNFLEDFVSQ